MSLYGLNSDLFILTQMGLSSIAIKPLKVKKWWYIIINQRLNLNDRLAES